MFEKYRGKNKSHTNGDVYCRDPGWTLYESCIWATIVSGWTYKTMDPVDTKTEY